MDDAEPVAEMIVRAAQQMVDGWLMQPGLREPFDTMSTKTSRGLWPDRATMKPQRNAFLAAADMIRLGRGHAQANPDPLFEVIDLKLAQR